MIGDSDTEPSGAPHLGFDELGNVTLEWWRGPRKITLYPAERMLLKVWGANVNDEMEEVALVEDDGDRAFRDAFAWLYAAPSVAPLPAPAAEPLTDYTIDRLWLFRKDLHDGELMPQLRDFARAIIAAIQRPK